MEPIFGMESEMEKEIYNINNASDWLEENFYFYNVCVCEEIVRKNAL